MTSQLPRSYQGTGRTERKIRNVRLKKHRQRERPLTDLIFILV